VGPDEARLAGDIIADGFHDDPVCIWAFNGRVAIKPFFTLLTAETPLPRGFGMRTADESGITLQVLPGESTKIGAWTTVKAVYLAARHGGWPALQRGPLIDKRG